MEVHFLEGHRSEDDYKFIAKVDGRRVVCRVSEAVIEDSFSVTGDTHIEQAFIEHRQVFEGIADSKIRANQFEDGGIVISASDVRTYRRR